MDLLEERMAVHGFGCVQLTAVSFVGIMAAMGYVTGRPEMVAPLWALLATGVTCLGCYGIERCRQRAPLDHHHLLVSKGREILVVNAIDQADQFV